MRRRMGRPGLMGTMARTAVVAGTATAVSGNVRRRGAQEQQAAAGQQQAMVDEAAAQAAAQTAAQMQPQAPAPAASIEDQVGKIKALGELKESGLLTEEEFAAAKAKILGS
jgi:Short C-terminal domain